MNARSLDPNAMREASHDGARPGSVGAHYTRYVLGNTLALAAGFVSFPILTRVLSNYQFGLIGYLDAILLLAVAVMKYGLGDAVMRFYPHGGSGPEFRRFIASLLLLPFTVSMGLWVLAMVVVALASWGGAIAHPEVVLLALATLPFSTFASYVQWVMAAQERSAVNAATNTLSKWLQTLLVLALVLLLMPNVVSVYLGRLLALGATAAWLGRWLWQQVRPRFADVDFALSRSAVIYGLPLAVTEMTHIAYLFIDRVMIKALLHDFAAVGVYTIGASLAAYVGLLVTSTLSQAYAPVINRIYLKEGADAVVAFKQRILLPMTYVVVLLVAGLLLTGRDFFLLISGHGKAGSAPVFVLLSTTLVLWGLMNVAGYGALLVKRTRRVLAVHLVGVLVNIALNLVLIPRFGVMGAVYAAIAVKPVVSFGIWLTCPKPMRSLPSARVLTQAIGLGLVASAAAWLVLQALPPHASLLRLAAGGLTLVLLYGVPVYLLVPELRTFAQGLLARVPGVRFTR